MKPLLFRNPMNNEESFYIQEDKLPHFYDILHYHPEFQLTLIIEGTGTCFIGDKIGRFAPGDIFLIGANLPHVFRSAEAYYSKDSKVFAHGISSYFKKESFGESFFDLPETHAIKDLLLRASRGLIIKGNTREIVRPGILGLVKQDGFQRLLSFLSILYSIATSTELEFISSIGFQASKKENDHKKINDVFNYVMKNFQKDIELDEIAKIASMSTTAFCRFFKIRTRKTFSEFLNEVRIGNACKLLINSSDSITEIAYKSGFNNSSNFNRAFKKITNYTPSGYLKRLRQS
jgi:AraC-like DNA-binding protein